MRCTYGAYSVQDTCVCKDCVRRRLMNGLANVKETIEEDEDSKQIARQEENEFDSSLEWCGKW